MRYVLGYGRGRGYVFLDFSFDFVCFVRFVLGCVDGLCFSRVL